MYWKGHSRSDGLATASISVINLQTGCASVTYKQASDSYRVSLYFSAAGVAQNPMSYGHSQLRRRGLFAANTLADSGAAGNADNSVTRRT